MRTITVIRNRGWYGMLRTAKLFADDLEIGQLKSAQAISVELPDDTDNLYAKMDWGWSAPYPAVEIADGQTIYMNSWFTLNLFSSLGVNSIPFALEDAAK